MLTEKLKNPVVRFVLVIISIFLGLIVFAQFMAKDAVADFLVRKLPDHVQLEYGDMNVNVLTGTVGLEDIDLNFFDRDSMLLNTEVKMEGISLNGLSYWQFFVEQNIAVDELHLQQPEVQHYLNRILPKKENEPKGVVQLLKTIEIEELRVDDGRLHLYQDGNDSIALRAERINFVVMDAKTGPEIITERIPVRYGNYNLVTKDLFVDLGPYEDVRVASVRLDDGNANISGVKLASKYSKAKLSTLVRAERDHVDLKIPETTLEGIEVSFRGDTLLVETGLGKIIGPKAKIFRDKLVDDEVSQKRLYSKMLRELPIYIDVPKVEIIDGNLEYSEQIETTMTPGKISFVDLNAELANISNVSQGNEKTTISANASLMGHAPIELNWNFDIASESDAFTASGSVKNFKTQSINAFLESNLRAKATGTIDRLYFTVSGNAIACSGDMKMQYEDFEFMVLKKNRLGINKLLTAIGKIFINDGSNADADGFRYGSIEVERDPSKSFFNYLWLNVREGILNTMTGRGVKKEE